MRSRTSSDDFTSDGFHRTKTITFGPDGWLYVAQGSTCNVCIEQDTRRAAILRMQPDGSQRELFATGLRNSVGLDWAPWDGALYATENGRDLLGDDLPPDELNRIEQGRLLRLAVRARRRHWRPGVRHRARRRHRPRGAARACLPRAQRAARPAVPARRHAAGRVFAHGARGLHGSWNRSQPDGYKVVALDFAADGRITQRDFLSGFQGADGLIGRPAGITQGPDGAIFVTDDYAGVIYRIVPAATP